MLYRKLYEVLFQGNFIMYLLIIAQFFLDCYTTTDPAWSFWLESKMLWWLRVFLLLQQWFTTISLKGAKSRSAILLENRTKILPQGNWHVLFYCRPKSVTQNIRCVTERHCLSKGILSQQRIRHQALTEYIFPLRSRRHQLLFK